MKTSKYSNSVSNLFRFMLLFDINRFELFKEDSLNISAKVGWADEGEPDYNENEAIQNIEWEVQLFENIDDALVLSEVLRDYKLIDIDKIKVSPEALYDKAKKVTTWNLKRYEDALNTLLKFKVDMIDNDIKTDYFFVHF